MMVPEFMRFYNYTATQTLGEAAVTFFALVNSMYRIKATESLNRIMEGRVAASEKDGGVIKKLQEQEKGLHGIVSEVRTVEQARQGRVN